jgi:VWFA-related protein
MDEGSYNPLVHPVHPVVLAVALAALQSQTPAPKFKSSLDLVRVDVNVIDGQGQPIRDLRAEEFELRVDGRRRQIVTAQFVPVGGGVDRLPVVASTDYSSNVESVGGRLIMLVVDRSSIGPGRGKAAFEAASRFVGGLNRADRIALASIPEGPQIDFTADHSLVQTRLHEIDGTALPNQGPRSIGISDALAFERDDQFAMDRVIERECGALPTELRGFAGGGELKICMDQVHSEAKLVASDARNRAQESIIGLEALIKRLPPSSTPKVLVYISEGMVLDRERAQLAWLGPRAAASHVTVYALHLMQSENDASRARPAATYTADRIKEEDGLALMTGVTRGDVFRVMGNSDFAFRRLSLELSGYYLLGFEAEPGDRNGRPHAIKVDVRRRGVTVRSRREFTIEPIAATDTAHAAIVAVLRDPLPATDIPIKVATYSFQDPHSSKLRLLVAAEIDRSVNTEGELSVGYVLVDFHNKLAGSQIDTAPSAALRKTDTGDGRTQQYFSTIVADPGKYTLKLVAVDDAGRRGSVERVVNAALAKAGPIHATDLLVASAPADGGDAPLAPAVSTDVTGDTLHGYLELFADAPEPLDVTSVTLEVAATQNSPPLQQTSVALRKPPDDARCRIVGAKLNIAKLPPGEYVARAVINVAGRRVGQVVRSFRIARPGA